jgi:prolyl 4-hydroxylase
LKETVHAGLPVTSGVKVGLNIWSWWQRGLEAEHLREEL